MASSSSRRDEKSHLEWIAEFSELTPFLGPLCRNGGDSNSDDGGTTGYGGISPVAASETNGKLSKKETTTTATTSTCIVLGCGFSGNSAALADLGCARVVSVDNDAACIAEMAALHEDDARLEWYTYDVVACRGAAAVESTSVDGTFDLVFDKGTLDYVLTEGVAYTMLADVYRLLRPGGTYALCSLQDADLLERLLNVPILGWDVVLHRLKPQSTTSAGGGDGGGGGDGDSIKDVRYTLQDDSSRPVRGILALCRKKSLPPPPTTASGTSIPPSLRLSVEAIDALARHEREASDAFFKLDNPLLTPAYEQALRERFMATAIAVAAAAKQATAEPAPCSTSVNSGGGAAAIDGTAGALDHGDGGSSGSSSNSTGSSSRRIRLKPHLAYELMFEPAERDVYTRALFESDLAEFRSTIECSKEKKGMVAVDIDGGLTLDECIAFLHHAQ